MHSGRSHQVEATPLPPSLLSRSGGGKGQGQPWWDLQLHSWLCKKKKSQLRSSKTHWGGTGGAGEGRFWEWWRKFRKGHCHNLHSCSYRLVLICVSIEHVAQLARTQSPECYFLCNQSTVHLFSQNNRSRAHFGLHGTDGAMKWQQRMLPRTRISQDSLLIHCNSAVLMSNTYAVPMSTTATGSTPPDGFLLPWAGWLHGWDLVQVDVRWLEMQGAPPPRHFRQLT